MPIKRCSDQQSKTLEEFYIFLSQQNTYYVDVAKQMLAFIDLINMLFKDTLIWGLTSHERLCLLNKDDSSADMLVIINSTGTNDYYFEYLLPADKQPWENAYVRGQASSIEEARKYLLIAMDDSCGWTDNSELNQLVKLNRIAN